MLPLLLVAVPVMKKPFGEAMNGTVTLPPSSVVTVVVVRKNCPSPLPDGSHAVLAKNSSTYEALGALFSVALDPAWCGHQNGEILQIIRAGVCVSGIVGGQPVPAEIDAESAVQLNAIATDVIPAGADIDSGTSVGRNQVRSRCRPNGVGGGLEVDARRIRNGNDGVRVQADEVGQDGVVSSDVAAQIDAGAAITGDDVSFSRRRAANDIARDADEHSIKPIAEVSGAIDVRANEVADDTVVRRAGTLDQNADPPVTRDDVAQLWS